VACNIPLVFNLDERRSHFTAGFLSERASGVVSTPARRIAGLGVSPRISTLLLLSRGSGFGTEEMSAAVYGCSSLLVISVTYFHDLSKIHYGYSVTHVTDDSHVVRDENVTHLIFVLNAP
jgi:hypothetical protein